MKKEKIVISFIAVLIGILAAGIAFFLYQTTKVIPNSNIKTITFKTPNPTPVKTQKQSLFLTVDSPKDEEVVTSRIIQLTGKTQPEAIVLVATENNDQVVTPTKNGDFSVTLSLDLNQNYIEITAISPNGEETKLLKIITVSTENF